MLIENFDFKNKEEKLDPRFIEEKTIDLLRNRGSLTFSEITKELNIENGDRTTLLNILQGMMIEGRIKKEKIQVTTEEGIIFTSKFFL